MEQFEDKNGNFSATEFRNKEVIDKIQTRNSFLEMLEHEENPMVSLLYPIPEEEKKKRKKEVKTKDKKFIEKHNIITKEEFLEKKKTIRKTPAPFIRPVPAGHTMPMGVKPPPLPPRPSRAARAAKSTVPPPLPPRPTPTTSSTSTTSSTTTTPLFTPAPTTTSKRQTRSSRPASASARTSSSSTIPLSTPAKTTATKQQTKTIATPIIQPAFQPPYSKEPPKGPNVDIVPPIPPTKTNNKNKKLIKLIKDGNTVTPPTQLLTGSAISEINKDMDKTKSVNAIIKSAESAREEFKQGLLSETEFRETINELKTHFRKYRPTAKFPEALK
jgi:hypothetical protein